MFFGTYYTYYTSNWSHYTQNKIFNTKLRIFKKLRFFKNISIFWPPRIIKLIFSRLHLFAKNEKNPKMKLFDYPKLKPSTYRVKSALRTQKIQKQTNNDFTTPKTPYHQKNTRYTYDTKFSNNKNKKKNFLEKFFWKFFFWKPFSLPITIVAWWPMQTWTRVTEYLL